MNAADLGLLRVAAASPELRVADPAFNAAETARLVRELAAQGVRLAVFPELGLTGYTCGDLFFQKRLLDAALEALHTVEEACRAAGCSAVVGLPLEYRDRLFNTAALVTPAGVAGFVPKSHLPNYGEYYEKRWFTALRPDDLACEPETEVMYRGRPVPFGVHLLFEDAAQAGCVLGIEICEDLWAVQPPSGELALAGATVIANLSAGDELLGKAAYRRELVRQQAARCLAAYVYAGAGPGESSMDCVFSGHCIISENGRTLGETERFRFESRTTTADLDLELLRHERRRNTTFTPVFPHRYFARIPVTLGPPTALGQEPGGRTLRAVDPHPFVPADPAKRDEHCREVLDIQATGLAKRLRHLGHGRLVLGVSGGLDSTLALLVAGLALDRLGLPRTDLLAVSLPGPGTSARTRANAERLARTVGATFREIPIDGAVAAHLADIAHDPAARDVTYENAQARERTQILMNLANQRGGIVLGTGDLSEAALGWCTFNGDHMSMYHVNAGVPKTLVRWLIAWAAGHAFAGACADALHDVLDTPVSPELLPPDDEGRVSQRTEEIIGPYELHDFFLHALVRHQFTPEKVRFLAGEAFAGKYAPDVIARWLAVFLKRFFAAQFKRSSMPDGPKVGSVALSPRADWRMPSDASGAAFT
jgi:NAD+ synthase (glutamine-hydrolysing)